MNDHTPVIAVIGLGYVGLPLAVAFGNNFKVIGFDIKKERIRELKDRIDVTRETSPAELDKTTVIFTDDPELLKEANFYIVTVPTPVDDAHLPDLRPVFGATETISKYLKKGDIVVYESTVYPGLTEEECLPIMERISGLKAGRDFKVGYSPERINPGDKEHGFVNIRKVVSAQDAESLERVAEIYGTVVKAGIFKARSIKAAEAAKVIENTQRDLNIALINELSIIFDIMGIETRDVLDAAATKWNFLKFTPGLVGGHCIGVDPYYLTHKAEKIGYIPQVILAGRRINDGMGKFIARKTVKEMIRAGINVHDSLVTVLGMTFKENIPDSRNSRVIDIIRELEDYGIALQICDPHADPAGIKHEYGVDLVPFEGLLKSDAIIAAVAHDEYKNMTAATLKSMMKEKPLLIDVKTMYGEKELTAAGIRSWRL